MPDLAPIVGVLLCALLIPLAIMIGRNNIRTYRQRLLEDLETAFQGACDQSAASGGPEIELVPSLEMARYKYDMAPSATTRAKAADQQRIDDQGQRIKQRSSWAYEARMYATPLLIYIVLSAVGFYTFFLLAESAEPWRERSFLLLGIQDWPPASDPQRAVRVEYQTQTATAISFAFIGAYVWSVIYLVRRIANYDLSPLSFLRVSVHILLASFTAAVLRHVLVGLTGTLGVSEVSGVLYAGLAFLMGFYPTLGIDYLLDRFPSLKLKKTDPKAHLISRNLPVSMIDGMDTFISFRFAEMEIEDVQNLATSNPILLFVETPYGLFEIIDWVAQAQLIVALGPEKVQKLRELGIRSIFCLESAASDAELCAVLAPILLGEPLQQQARPGDRPAAVIALVGTIGNNLHVQRLRQVWNAVLVVVTPPDGRPPDSLWVKTPWPATVRAMQGAKAA